MTRNLKATRNLTDPFNIIFHPWLREKSDEFRVNPKENKLDFVVNRRATKADIKWAVEHLYKVKVEKVNTRIMKEGKHALVKLAKGYSADELGMNIGIL